MINRLTYSIAIEASKATIWKNLWNNDAYRDWAGIFGEGSYLKCDQWEVGNTVFFLSQDESGIYSTIEKYEINELIEFKHIGSVFEGKKQVIDDAVRKWTGATEVYSICQEKEHQLLTIEIDVLDEHLEFMEDRLPKALERIKSNCTK